MNWSTKSVTEASGLLAGLTTSSFILACVCASYLFGFTKSLSVMLQGTRMDVVRAYEQISLVTDELKAVRDKVDEEFDSLFTAAEQMAGMAGIVIGMPRICHRQTLCNNITAEEGSPKVYWKRAIFIPSLDGLITQLSDRFSSGSCQAVRGLCLLPQNLSQCSNDRVDDIIEYYGPDMPSPASAKQEIRLWKRYWADHRKKDMPATLSTTIKGINHKQFPSIYAVRHILLLLPVTSAEVEGAHSGLMLIKTNLHNTVGEDRLNALLLLYYHKTFPWTMMSSLTCMPDITQGG